MKGFEENEISKNAFGGTELAKRKLSSILDPNLLDNFQIVCARIRDLNPEKIRIFWAHDLAEDPESQKFRDPDFRNSFHKFVFISQWQYQRYMLVHGMPYDDKSIVLESGIEPASPECLEQKDKEKIRLVYTSTPQRGLELLVPVFEHLAQKYPDIHLDVFSSFKIYGWEDADKKFQPLYDMIINHPQMTYHGFTPHEDLLKHLNKCHIFAYPNIWLETSCRAMLESMSAGLVCVHPNYGALPDTSGALNVMYQGNEVDRTHHANIFAGALEAAINFVKNDNHKAMVSFNKTYVDSRFNIERIKNQWNMMLNRLMKEYPTAESREIPKKQFVYKTS